MSDKKRKRTWRRRAGETVPNPEPLCFFQWLAQNNLKIVRPPREQFKQVPPQYDVVEITSIDDGDRRIFMPRN